MRPSTMARSSGIELADSPPGASGGSRGEGELGGGGRGGGGGGGRAGGEGGANGLNAAMQQPVQSQSKRRLRSSQVKDLLKSAQVFSRPHGRAQGSSPAAVGSWQSSRPRRTNDPGAEGVG